MSELALRGELLGYHRSENAKPLKEATPESYCPYSILRTDSAATDEFTKDLLIYLVNSNPRPIENRETYFPSSLLRISTLHHSSLTGLSIHGDPYDVDSSYTEKEHPWGKVSKEILSLFHLESLPSPKGTLSDLIISNYHRFEREITPHYQRVGTLAEQSNLTKKTEVEAVERAKKLLSRLHAKAIEGKALEAKDCDKLRDLADSSIEVIQYLSANFDIQKPQIKWLLIEILSLHDWEVFSRDLLAKLPSWNSTSDRTAILGAVVTIRRYKLADDLRTPFRYQLIQWIEKSPPEALDGRDPLQSELLVQTLVTLGSFATPAELTLLHRIALGSNSYEAILTSANAIARIAARNPSEKIVQAYFSASLADLEGKIRTFANTRNVTVQNGSLLWAFCSLLLARLGPESESLIPIAKSFPSLLPKLLNLINHSKQVLKQLKQEMWLKDTYDETLIAGLKTIKQTDTTDS